MTLFPLSNKSIQNPYEDSFCLFPDLSLVFQVDCNEEGGMEEVLVLGCDTKN